MVRKDLLADLLCSGNVVRQNDPCGAVKRNCVNTTTKIELKCVMLIMFEKGVTTKVLFQLL